MPENANSLASDWDFLTVLSWWNQFGLPALLLLVVVVLAVLRRTGHCFSPLSGEAARDRPLGDARPFLAAARIIALIHLGLGLRAGVRLVQELLTLREQGIPQSFLFTGMILPAIAFVVNLTIGHGLWRVYRWAWRGAIAWNAIVAVIAALVAAWRWWFQVAFRIDEWPDHLVAFVVPWLLLVVLSLPGARALFRGHLVTSAKAQLPSGAPDSWRPWPITLLLVGLFLVVVSTLAADTFDWMIRLMSRTEV